MSFVNFFFGEAFRFVLSLDIGCIPSELAAFCLLSFGCNHPELDNWQVGSEAFDTQCISSIKS